MTPWTTIFFVCRMACREFIPRCEVLLVCWVQDFNPELWDVVKWLHTWPPHSHKNLGGGESWLREKGEKGWIRGKEETTGEGEEKLLIWGENGLKKEKTKDFSCFFLEFHQFTWTSINMNENMREILKIHPWKNLWGNKFFEGGNRNRNDNQLELYACMLAPN